MADNFQLCDLAEDSLAHLEAEGVKVGAQDVLTIQRLSLTHGILVENLLCCNRHCSRHNGNQIGLLQLLTLHYHRNLLDTIYQNLNAYSK